MANDYVTVGQVQAPVYVTGERFPTRNNVGLALEDVESSGLIALTGPTGAQARIVAPLNDKIWDWFHVLSGIYNITDHKGRFGNKGAKVDLLLGAEPSACGLTLSLRFRARIPVKS